jgi:hypothetical protein
VVLFQEVRYQAGSWVRSFGCTRMLDCDCAGPLSLQTHWFNGGSSIYPRVFCVLSIQFGAGPSFGRRETVLVDMHRSSCACASCSRESPLLQGALNWDIQRGVTWQGPGMAGHLEPRKPASRSLCSIHLHCACCFCHSCLFCKGRKARSGRKYEVHTSPRLRSFHTILPPPTCRKLPV